MRLYAVFTDERPNTTRLFEVVVSNPTEQRAKIYDLVPNTEYAVYIWAHTAAGAGTESALHAATLRSMRMSSSLHTFVSLS